MFSSHGDKSQKLQFAFKICRETSSTLDNQTAPPRCTNWWLRAHSHDAAVSAVGHRRIPSRILYTSYTHPASAADDIDKDGFISNGELFQVLKVMVGDNLQDTQLQQIVDKTIIYADEVR